jgi:hypothetical protein
MRRNQIAKLPQDTQFGYGWFGVSFYHLCRVAELKTHANHFFLCFSQNSYGMAVKVNPPNNALRHSYASYWLARSSKEGLGELSKRMGNSEAVCKRHYLETLTREEGAAWFKIRRSKAGGEPVSMVSAKAA